MRRFNCLLAVCVVGAVAAGQSRPARAESAPDPAAMTAGEATAAARKLYRPDLPFAHYLDVALDRVETEWPALTPDQRRRMHAFVLYDLRSALEPLAGLSHESESAAEREQGASIFIATALEKLRLSDEARAFSKDVFASAAFQHSASSYHGVVADLWARYAKAGKTVPAARLLLLNQPAYGRPGRADYWPNEQAVGDIYKDLGDFLKAAEWYQKVPPGGLGLLNAADAYYQAGRMDDAARLYRQVLRDLGTWAALKPTLRRTQLAEPLEFTDLDQVRRDVLARLAAIDRRRGQ